MRTAIAAQRLGTALDEAGPAKVEIRMLGDHLEKFDASSLTGESRAEAISRWSGLHIPGSPRIPFTLPRESENWLVSDGTDQIVNTWMRNAGFSRTIAVGSLTENTAITAVMARRALQPETPHHGSVWVTNMGSGNSIRALTIRVDGQIIVSEDIEIAPGGETYRSFGVPTGTAVVAATLLPADALALDDTLEIALGSLRPVAVDFNKLCGSHFSAAMNAHPGLELHTGAEQKPELTVRCTPFPRPLASASISVHTGNNYEAITGLVEWHQPIPELSGMFLDRSWLQINKDSAPPLSDRTLLSAPDMNLSLIDAQAGVVDVFLDLESAPIVERLEYPLLVNTLVELALARPVLDPVVLATRNPAESRIDRQSVADITASPVAVPQVRTDLAPYLLAMAALLLLVDIILSLQEGALRRKPVSTRVSGSTT